MSKTKSELKEVDIVSEVTKSINPINLICIFRDKVYTSRTLILPSGAALPVAKGRVTATTDDQLQYLSTHPDFERLTE